MLLFKNGDDDPTRNSFDEYYMTLVEIKDFKALIDNKAYETAYDQLVKSKQEAYDALAEMSRNDYYTTENLLDCLYHEKYYRLIGIYVPRQANTTIPQQINCTGKSEEDLL